MNAEPLTIQVDAQRAVSALWFAPSEPCALFVFAHGAGAGMAHKHMAQCAEGLAARGVATLRYNFPYMEAVSKRPDPAPLCHATVRAAVAAAHLRAPNLPMFAGGRSFGARMTSQAQAKAPLELVRGLIFFAFPLHPAGKPSSERAAHLADVAIPMLFLQGDKDTLAELDLLKPVVQSLEPRAELALAAHADHSFHAPAKSGRKDAEVLAEMLDAAAAWIVRVTR